jgi:hypothetical protein
VDVMVVQEDVAESTPFAFRASSNSKNPSAAGSRRSTGAPLFPSPRDTTGCHSANFFCPVVPSAVLDLRPRSGR